MGTELPESAITPNPRLKDIAAQYKSQCVAGSKLRHFGGITLGFVTPVCMKSVSTICSCLLLVHLVQSGPPL